MSDIMIKGAREGNLKDISLAIPRGKLIVFTGLSGSGKTTLVMDVLYQECQRQYLEAIGYQGIKKPKVDSVCNLSPAVRITQTDSNTNPRSTVGTLTDIYTELRMIYEKLGVRACPKCHEMISAAECKEETEKIDDSFKVYMYCSRCNGRMEKLTRTHFSHNTREGSCKTCQGLGSVLTIIEGNVIDESLSLENGAVDFWEQQYKEYQISSLYAAFRHYGVSVKGNTPVADFDVVQKDILLYGVESDGVKQAFPNLLPPKTVASGKFEGVFTTLWRRMSDKGGDAKQLNGYFDYAVCPDCKGERLGELSRSATVENTRLPELASLSLDELCAWVAGLDRTLSDSNRITVESYLLDLKTKIQRIVNVGLGYLSLDRQTVTLSGGELQRVRLAAALDSDLTGVIYMMDEPTIGLHPRDTEGMVKVLARLRDLGNTVVVIEHDPDVMKEADYVIDIGPGSGKHGGEIIGLGTLEQLKTQDISVTGAYLRAGSQPKREFRKGSGDRIEVRNANLYNLQDIDVTFPHGCLVAVTGVSGSGKSTLVFDVLGESGKKGRAGSNIIHGMGNFHRIVTIEQSAISKMKRSNVATYSEAYSEIRQIFGGLKDARDRGLTAKHFSFNSKGGRCENCEGLGYVKSNMLFFEDIEVPCPICGGNQFSDEVLSVKYKEHSIKDILRMCVEDAVCVFGANPKLEKILGLLQDVGLGYLELGQTVTTLSGGEGQRLKLARELIGSTGQDCLYLMDEPTVGLHPADVQNFITLLDRIVDSGNTVIVVEHNQQVIAASDWIIDLGPSGGRDGGKVVFAGTPLDMVMKGETTTADYMRKYMDLL